MRRLLAILLVLAAAAAAVVPPLIELVYGADFSRAGSVLLVLLLPFPLLPLGITSDALLFGLGRLRFLVLAGLIAAALNLALDFLLIPAHGAIGAAWANAGAQAVGAAAGLVYAARMLRPLDVAWGALARALVVAAATGGAAAGAVASSFLPSASGISRT
jgi:O-antigen/teichoic acid export membrane protein